MKAFEAFLYWIMLQHEQCCECGCCHLCDLRHVLCASKLCPFPNWGASLKQQTFAVCQWHQPHYILGHQLHVGHGEIQKIFCFLPCVNININKTVWMRGFFDCGKNRHRIFSFLQMNYLIPAVLCIFIFLAFGKEAYVSAQNAPCLVALLLLYGWALSTQLYFPLFCTIIHHFLICTAWHKINITFSFWCVLWYFSFLNFHHIIEWL